jgi:hypothetical protein
VPWQHRRQRPAQQRSVNCDEDEACFVLTADEVQVQNPPDKDTYRAPCALPLLSPHKAVCKVSIVATWCA